MIVVKVVFAILAFMLSILAFEIFWYMGNPIHMTDEPDAFDRGWSVIGKAMSVGIGLLAVVVWYYAFAL